MKRLPLVIGVVISCLLIGCALPFLAVLWLLVGEKPFDIYVNALNSIVFQNNIKI